MSASEEQSSYGKNTYVIDPESAAEMARLMRQDQLVTSCMGGALPEIDLSSVQRVLDLACGPGGWSLEAAYTYSDLEVVGVDISKRMIAYAQAQAQVQQRTNVSFQVMDILGPLDFPNASFDLVNVRFISAFMLRDKWPSLFQEILRVLRPGGILRLTEPEVVISNKPNLEKVMFITSQMMNRAGLNFSPMGYHYGIIQMLPYFFRQAGLPILGKKAHFIECSFGAEMHESFYHDMCMALQLIGPMVVKMQLATSEEWQDLVQKCRAEMYEEDFCAAWIPSTVWGEKPL
ncbi:MAG TPA: class I SAM-dependent methyltransferase [Ktedonobacteraceae bacterium]|jgi:SAM-dependent methyltransferase